MLQGKPEESRAAFKASEGIFASLPWKYPLAALSVNNCTLYADAASVSATKSDETIIEDSCAYRMIFLRWWLGDYDEENKALPPDLNTLKDWAVVNRARLADPGWVTGDESLETTKQMFSCPGSKDNGPVPFIYRKSAAVGEVILTCPNHPENSVKLESWMIGK